MKDLDSIMAGWSTDRDHSFKIRQEIFRGRLGLDYEIVTHFMSCVNAVNAEFANAVKALLLAFLGTDEYERFEAWRVSCRDEGNPVNISEMIVVGIGICEEEAGRPTLASSSSSTGRETSGDGSTVDSSSPVTETVPPASLSAVS